MSGNTGIGEALRSVTVQVSVTMAAGARKLVEIDLDGAEFDAASGGAACEFGEITSMQCERLDQLLVTRALGLPGECFGAYVDEIELPHVRENRVRLVLERRGGGSLSAEFRLVLRGHAVAPLPVGFEVFEVEDALAGDSTGLSVTTGAGVPLAAVWSAV